MKIRQKLQISLAVVLMMTLGVTLYEWNPVIRNEQGETVTAVQTPAKDLSGLYRNLEKEGFYTVELTPDDLRNFGEVPPESGRMFYGETAHADWTGHLLYFSDDSRASEFCKSRATLLTLTVKKDKNGETVPLSEDEQSLSDLNQSGIQLSEEAHNQRLDSVFRQGSTVCYVTTAETQRGEVRALFHKLLK